MKPLWYADVRVAAGVSERGPSGVAIAALAAFMRTVHGAAKARSLKFAAAFPGMRTGRMPHPGTVLRLFTEDRDGCEVLADAIEASPICASMAMMSRVKPVPTGVTRAVSYVRVRIPARNSIQTPADLERRQRRIRETDAMPYLKTFSRSTGQVFSLRVNRIEINDPPSVDFEPDGYGLSVGDRAFALPDLPLQPAPWEVIRSEARATAR